MEDSKRNTVELLVGFAVLALIGYGVYWVSAAGSRWLWPPQESVTALSACFDNGKLQIAGHLHCGGQPATGKAKVTVRTIDWAFRHSVMADLKDGRFVIRDAPEFRILQSKDQAHVRADFTLDSGFTTTEEIYLNTPSPTRSGNALIILSIIGLVTTGLFFWAFTGPGSPRKNRAALIYSYCVIVVVLALPLMAPLVIGRMFPELQDLMNNAAVGIVITKPRDTGMDTQWALNIGGHAREAIPDQGENPSPAGPQQFENPTTPIPKDSENPTTAAPKQGETSPAPTTKQGEGPTPPVTKPADDARRRDPRKVVNVTGGLIIPLYVIILSVIGGAINMTRQVPQFQKQDESWIRAQRMTGMAFMRAAGAPLAQVCQSLVEKVIPKPTGGETVLESKEVITVTGAANAEGGMEPPTPRPPEATTPNSAPETPSVEVTKASSDALAASEATEMTPAVAVVAEQELKPAPAPSALEATLKDNEWTAQWRSGLLNQYMYLLSAPFLAIATYYLLSWLQLTKEPILVLVSFSIGLISESIVRAILKTVSGFIGEGGSQAAAGASGKTQGAAAGAPGR